MARWKQKTKLLIGLFAALAIGLVACSDDDSGGFTGSGQPQLQPNPENVLFTDVSIGDTEAKIVEITNDGDNVLRLRSIELYEEAGGEFDGASEFEKGEIGWTDGEIELGPGEKHEIEIKYSPENETADKGHIAIENNDPSVDGGVFKLPLESAGLQPEINSSPGQLSWDRLDPSEEDEDWNGEDKFLTIQNVGSAPLRISNIYVSGSERFTISMPSETDPARENDTDEWPEALAPEERFDVRVNFLPDDSLPESAELIFESNDPESREMIVPLSGNSGAPCLRVSPGEEVAFGQGSLGQTSQKTVTLENCSRGAELDIEGISITDDGGGAFAIQDGSLPGDLPEDTTTIAPGDRSNFVVTFIPDEETDYNGELLIESNDPANREKTVPITGDGSDNACPEAVAKAALQGSSPRGDTIETIPLNTVEFDGSDSNDPDGSIDRYEWTILSRPNGSTQRLTPDSSVENPRLFLDLAGVYEVELKVYDDEGAASCGDPAVITIIAEPDDDVHVQLVWDTPSDPDQTDDHGTDLDLHYVHPNGRWNESPWDIFWRNRTADWDDNGSGPSLDIDDTNGAGPENINHSGLDNLTYRTGVYYYSDSGLGASYATARVYVRGQLELEIKNKYMPGTGSFWDVATIQWPSGDVVPISRMYQGFP
ncbi:MAG: choice-of-anchor D domain-containing protein [Persicimonas sp.]